MNRSYDDFSTHHAWISRLTPAGAVTRYDIPNRFEPTGSIAAGADGNMWFTTDDLHGIGTVGTGLPGAPGGVSVGVAGGTATVSWSPPSTDGGSPVLGYTVTATPGGQRCTWLAGPLSCTLTGLPVGAPITLSVVATNVNGPGPAAAVSHGVPPEPTGVPFHALTPARIYDSRPNGPDVFPFAPWTPGETRDVKVAGPGVGGVPSAADAVVLNVTVTGTTAAGWLTVWPAGQARPTASSLNWSSGQTVANAVTVKVGAGGNVSVHNPIGKAHVIIDVVGWYGIDPGSGYTPLTPARILDSRLAPGGTPWTPGQTRDTKVLGVGGVQPQADTVVVNVTVTGTTAAGYLTIWPAGQPRPIASSLNWAPGQTVANAVTVKAGAGGAISIFNPSGSTHVILDIVGSFTPGSGHLFHPQAPVRIQDSRPPGPRVGPYGTAWGPATARDVQVGGAGGVPVGAAAALLNVTATDTTATSYLTIAPTGTAPLASSLNWVAGQTVPNSVPAKLSPDGAITIRNFAGNAHVIADVAGWYG